MLFVAVKVVTLVVGSMMNIALNKINKPIVGIIGLVENMPDGKSQRPGDLSLIHI